MSAFTRIIVVMLVMFSKEDESKQPATALVNVQLRNSMALLRRCCNHPYLIEYPMDNGQLRVDESLVTACGKLMLLDRMLTELKKNGHKVYSRVLFCATCYLFHVYCISDSEKLIDWSDLRYQVDVRVLLRVVILLIFITFYQFFAHFQMRLRMGLHQL